MNSKVTVKLSFIFGISALCLLAWYFISNSIAEKREFHALFEHGAKSGIKMIVISGQGRSITVADRETLMLWEKIFSSPSTGPTRLGVTYEATIEFLSGRKFNTLIYIHKDGGGITMEDSTTMHAGDPRMVMFRFSRPLDPRLLSLIELLEKSNSGNQ